MTAQDRQASESPRRLDPIKQRMRERFADDDGNPPSDEELAEVVEEKAAQFEDAPIQAFALLLTEHDTRVELRERGLHPRLGGAGEPDTDDVDPDDTDPDEATTA